MLKDMHHSWNQGNTSRAILYPSGQCETQRSGGEHSNNSNIFPRHDIKFLELFSQNAPAWRDSKVTNIHKLDWNSFTKALSENCCKSWDSTHVHTLPSVVNWCIEALFLCKCSVLSSKKGGKIRTLWNVEALVYITRWSRTEDCFCGFFSLAISFYKKEKKTLRLNGLCWNMVDVNSFVTSGSMFGSMYLQQFNVGRQRDTKNVWQDQTWGKKVSGYFLINSTQLFRTGEQRELDDSAITYRYSQRPRLGSRRPPRQVARTPVSSLLPLPACRHNIPEAMKQSCWTVPAWLFCNSNLNQRQNMTAEWLILFGVEYRFCVSSLSVADYARHNTRGRCITRLRHRLAQKILHIAYL